MSAPDRTPNPQSRTDRDAVTAADVLNWIRALGCHAERVGDRLSVGPRSQVTPELDQAIRVCRDELLHRVDRAPFPPPPGGPAAAREALRRELERMDELFQACPKAPSVVWAATRDVYLALLEDRDVFASTLWGAVGDLRELAHRAEAGT